jgi:hypothetical protein
VKEMVMIIAIPTSYGVIITAAGRVDHWNCNVEICSQAAQDLGVDYEILAPDRLRIHPPFLTWDRKIYHRRYVELLVEKGLT